MFILEVYKKILESSFNILASPPNHAPLSRLFSIGNIES